MIKDTCLELPLKPELPGSPEASTAPDLDLSPQPPSMDL